MLALAASVAVPGHPPAIVFGIASPVGALLGIAAETSARAPAQRRGTAAHAR